MSAPFAAVVGYDIYRDMQQSVAHTKTSLRLLVDVMVGVTGNKIVAARRTLEDLAARPLVKRVDPALCDTIMAESYSLNRRYANIVYTDLRGKAICAALPPSSAKSLDVGDTPWFQRLLREKRFTIGQPHFDATSGKWVFDLSLPISSESGETVGVIYMPFDLFELNAQLPEGFLSAGSRYGIFAADGVMLWRNRDPERVIGTRPDAAAARRIVAVKDGDFEELAVDGVVRYFSVASMPETGWIAFVGVPTTDLYSAARQRALMASLLTLGVIAVVLYLAILIARRIARPVLQLEKTAHAVHAGDLMARASVVGPREVVAVAAEFNAMIVAQQRSERQLRAFLENSAVIAWLKNEAGVFVFVSDNYLRQFALERAAVIGHTDYDIWPQELADEFCRNDRQLLRQGHAIEAIEAARNPDGSVSWWLVKKFVVVAYDGARLVGGLAVDITARKQAEEALRTNEELLKEAQSLAGLGSYVLDVPTMTWSSSPELDRIFGIDAAYARTLDGWAALIHDADRKTMIDYLVVEVLTRRNPFDKEYRIVRRNDGAECWVHGLGRLEFDAQGRLVEMHGAIQDITVRKQAEVGLRQAASVFTSSQEGIMIVDAEFRITDINPAFERITGYRRDEVLGNNPRILSSGRQSPQFYAEMFLTLKTRGTWQGELWNRRKSGELYAERQTIDTVRDDNGELTHYVAVFSDISQLKEHESELDRIAHYDALTNVPNRRLLADRLNQAVARAKRSGKYLAVCYLDLDGFKPVNDNHGHAMGDRLLVEVTARLRGELRADDTLARLGGDEFVLLLTELAKPEELESALERVLAVVAMSVTIDGIEIRVSVSIGVTVYPDDNVDPDALLRHADQAMYAAKQDGKNRYCRFAATHPA